MKSYDYIIVGAGFFGATFARLATDAGRRCIILESRNHIAGNAYTERVDDIDVHVYGPHIFHTDNKNIWDFVNRFSEFNNYINSPKVFAQDKMWSLPFNMNTFYQLWGVKNPKDAKSIIESQRLKLNREPANLEEQALCLVGHDIYELFIRDYTQKQWQKHPRELPADIIKRIPLRFIYNDNYFNDRYQGIPVDGYTKLFENMLDGIEVRLNTNYLMDIEYWNTQADKIVYTGRIDEFFGYQLGELDYRTQVFKHTVKEDTDNYQGTAVVNYPELEFEYTRVIEHKHFKKSNSTRTVITEEIPDTWSRDRVPYYPINDEKNTAIYEQYRREAELLPNVIFGGRLAEYRYYDMHQVIGSAMKAFKQETQQ
jgi:UDP-galactopyranose mutase